MRFEQLKRKPNAIVKKKMYKARKNWVVASTIAFIGGVTLLSSQTLTAKADDNTDSNITQTETVSQDTQAPQGDTTANTGTINVEPGSADPNNKQQSSENIVDNGQDNNLEKNDSGNVGYDGSNGSIQRDDNLRIDSNEQEGITNTTDVSDSNAGGIYDTSNIASGNIGAGYKGGSEVKGSSWYINSKGVLHIDGGNWAGLPYDPSNWGNHVQDITSIQFDGKVKAGDSIGYLFYNSSALTDLGNMKDMFDTSDTTFFSEMFSGSGLTNFDFSTLDFSKAVAMTKMFSGSHLKSVNLSGFDFPNNSNYSGLFSNCPELTEVNMSGFHFHKSSNVNLDIRDMFSGDESLNKIILDGVDTSEVNNMGQLFDGDTSLESLDLSSFEYNVDDVTGNDNTNMLRFKDNWSGDSSKSTKIKSLTLNPNLNLLESGLNFDESEYLGWVSDADPSADPISSADLIAKYDHTDNAPDGIQTWSLVPRPTVTYTVNYFLKGQDPKTTNPIKSKTLSGNKDKTRMTIPQIPGYGLVSDNPIIVDYSAGEKQTIDAFVETLKPYTLDINITYDDNSAKPQVIQLKVPANPGDVSNNTDIINQLNQLSYDENNLDPDKTEFNLDAFAEGAGSMNLTKITELLSEKGSVDAKNPLKQSIIFMLGYLSPVLSKEGYEVTDFLDVHYKTYVPTTPSDNNSNSGSSASSSTTKPDREVDDINQTSATYSDQPKVQLYDYDGNLIDGEFLAPNTSWYNDKKMILNGKMYYRVSTGKWVSANDVYVYVARNTYVRVYKDNYGSLTNVHGKALSRELKPATDWFSDRTVYINGEKYYRVATNEFVNANNVYEYTYDSPVILTNNTTAIYDEKGNLTTIELPTNSSYKTDRYGVINGEKYYRVATNEFVKAEDVNL
ncbi:BspA family leucine-rich repeat surface protein [Companilactobacillus sp. HBUAS59699]|uniref:BspA family leucine-rich repeat surface protein n=1 Tax=Companilactobacillus sp. HBUAS59699 TaxID=3109358 RepID=UPI002FEF4C4B